MSRILRYLCAVEVISVVHYLLKRKRKRKKCAEEFRAFLSFGCIRKKRFKIGMCSFCLSSRQKKKFACVCNIFTFLNRFTQRHRTNAKFWQRGKWEQQKKCSENWITLKTRSYSVNWRGKICMRRRIDAIRLDMMTPQRENFPVEERRKKVEKKLTINGSTLVRCEILRRRPLALLFSTSKVSHTFGLHYRWFYIVAVACSAALVASGGPISLISPLRKTVYSPCAARRFFYLFLPLRALCVLSCFRFPRPSTWPNDLRLVPAMSISVLRAGILLFVSAAGAFEWT